MSLKNVSVTVSGLSKLEHVVCLIESKTIGLTPNGDRTTWKGTQLVDVRGPLDYAVGIITDPEVKWKLVIKDPEGKTPWVDRDKIVPVRTIVDEMHGSVDLPVAPAPANGVNP